MVDAILTQTLLPEISRELLNRMMDGTEIKRVELSVAEAKFHYHFQ